MTKLLEGNNKYRLILVLLLSFFAVVTVLAIVLSNIEFEEKVNGTVAIILNEGDLTINYTDGQEIKFNDSKEHSYVLSITNNSSTKVYYSVYFEKANIDDISVKIKDSSDKVLNTIEEDVTSNKLINLFCIEGNETIRYTIVVGGDKKVKFQGLLKVDNESMVTETFSDLVLLNNNINVAQTRIGAEIATSNEGLLSTIDNKGTTYYFRGNVDNNYVKIGELLFRVVRINGDSTVRLVLDGVINDTFAYNTNSLDDSSKVNSLVLFGNSSVRTNLENWLKSSLGTYSKYIVDGDFCSDTLFTLNVNNISYSSAYERVFYDESPDLYCSGNVYRGKVGLLSVDEVVFAGASGNRPNTSYYLYNKNIPGNYLTTNSYFINADNSIAMMNVMSNGAIGEGILIATPSYIRPVINISVDANIKGNGTKNNPYIIVS
ncbi:MAG: hypothetical protein ACI4XM_07340 [Candidatus Coprovivens sp.]